jgi:hypothetical protein
MSTINAAADTLPRLTWTFQRGVERLIVERRTDDERHSLVVTRDSGAHAISFNAIAALETFQADMERVLLSTGWLLATFAPDRRQYRDRRTFPRIDDDRRRWWTDAREQD